MRLIYLRSLGSSLVRFSLSHLPLCSPPCLCSSAFSCSLRPLSLSFFQRKVPSRARIRPAPSLLMSCALGTRLASPPGRGCRSSAGAADGQPAPARPGVSALLVPTGSGVWEGNGFSCSGAWASAGLLMGLVPLSKDAGLVCFREAGTREAPEANGEEKHGAGVPASAEGEASGGGEAGGEDG